MGGKINIIYSDKISERKFGDLEGRTADKFAQVNINDLYNFNYEEKYGGVETLKNFYSRTSELLNEIKEEYKDKNVMLVTHGGTIRVINAYFNGIPENGILDKDGVRNCELREYDL